MTQRELRNIIVKQLHTYLAGPKVVLSDQTAPEADYPLIYYQSVQQHIPGAANITTAAADGGALTKYRREHAEATFSFTACSFNRQGEDGPISGDDEALELADRAQGFFLFAGRQLLADLGVVVVRVENTQSRSAFDTDETDRRYGFDVLFRYEREDKRAVPAISKPPITFTKEEYAECYAGVIFDTERARFASERAPLQNFSQQTTKREITCKEDDTMEQEKRIAYLVKNDWSTAPVPTEYRRSNYGVVATLVGQIIALSGIYIGAGMVGGLTLTQAFIATVIGSIILAVLGGFLSWVGTKTGVGLSMLLRESFGTIGSYIVSLMLLLVAVGFFGYQATFFGATIHAMFPAGGWITSQTVAGVWGGILMMTTALIGYKGIEWLSNWASPLILVMCVLSCILAIVKIGSLEAFNGITIGYTGMTIPTAVVAVVGGYAFGACLQPDFSRMGKSLKASTWGSVGGFLIANVFMTMAGYITCAACGTGDVPTALLQILGYWALLILVFAQWTSNDGNLYFGTLALTTILPRANKHILTAIFGVVGIALSSLGITNYFLTFLGWLGTAIPPVAGIVIVDYFIIRKGEYHYGEGVKHHFCNVLALVAWIAGAVVGFTVHWGIAAINAIVTTAVVYLVLSLIFKNSDKIYIGPDYVEDEVGSISPVKKGVSA